MIPLECAVQQYAWGKPGLKSTVAQLAKEQGQEVDEAKPYAELWTGTHPNGPSVVKGGEGKQELLSEFLKKNPEMVSTDAELQKGNGDLPYLFKILSVNKALSIQAHPDKKLAEKLHSDKPTVYKDPNHKPEMACAITEFEALAGFFPIQETLAFIESTPELKDLLNVSEDAKAILSDGDVIKDLEASKNEEKEKEVLRVLFSCLMKSDAEKASAAVKALETRLDKDAEKLEMPNKLALRLCKQYPGDIGVFCVYFMCYRLLKPGQAVFLGANEPHAYLSGDCAEIMACSDNVVRAGLTPKLRDVDNLVSMLTYRQPSHKGAEFHPGNLLEGLKLDDHSQLYRPPDDAVTEFQMQRIVLTKDDGEYTLAKSTYGSIILVLTGSGSAVLGSTDSDVSSAKRSKDSIDFKRGDIFFQPAGAQDKLQAAGTDELILFRASLKGAF